MRLMKQRDTKGILFLIIGIAFWMIDITFMNLDLFPNTIGACLVYIGLNRLSYHEDSFQKPMKYVMIYGIIEVVDYYSFLFFQSANIFYYIYAVLLIASTTYLMITFYQNLTQALIAYVKPRQKTLLLEKIKFRSRDLTIALIVDAVASIIGVLLQSYAVAFGIVVHLIFLAIELCYLIMLYEVRKEFKDKNL